MSFGHCGIDWLHSLFDCNRQILILPELSFYRYWKILGCDNVQGENEIYLLWINHFNSNSRQSLDIRMFHSVDEKVKFEKNFKAGIDLFHASDLMALDQSMIVVQAKLGGEVVAIRVASVCNDHLLDLIAASNEGAIKCYANYLLMWEMILKTKELKKEFFDAGGIDPGSNIGVFNFKKGLNGRLTINGPLWCKGSNPLLEWTTRIFFL